MESLAIPGQSTHPRVLLHTLRLLLFLFCWLPSMLPNAAATATAPTAADLPVLLSRLEDPHSRFLVRQNPWSHFDPDGLETIDDYESQASKLESQENKDIHRLEHTYGGDEEGMNSARREIERNYEPQINSARNAIRHIEDTANWWNKELAKSIAQTSGRCDKATLDKAASLTVDPRQLDDASDQFKTMVSEKDSWAGAIVDAIAFAGYVRLGNAGGTVGSSASRAAATEGEGWVPQLMQQHQAGSAAKTTPVWPKSVEEMNAFLRMEGKAIPDTLRTSGRNKTVWNLCDSKITLEQHPYDVGAPAYHTDPHWHLDTPGMDHVRYLPGDPIPGY